MNLLNMVLSTRNKEDDIIVPNFPSNFITVFIASNKYGSSKMPCGGTLISAEKNNIEFNDPHLLNLSLITEVYEETETLKNGKIITYLVFVNIRGNSTKARLEKTIKD